MPGHHALLSPSKAKQWLACPPSARLNAKLADRFGEQSSEYAREGTTAHALAELKLRLELGEINKFNFDAQKKLLVGVDTAMDRYTDIYIDEVLGRYYEAKKRCPDTLLLVEQRLDMSPWIPGCFGTGDAVIVSDDTLEIADLKYGKGVPVSAVENPQARCYGLGAINEFGALYSFKFVRDTIIQPRLDSITDETLSREDLLSWGESIKPLAEQAWKGEGKYNPGDHCRFCNARAICKARMLGAFDLFSHGFDSPDVLPDDAIPGILRVADVAEQWIKDVRTYALNQALNGQEWNGFKLVRNKRPARAFLSEEDAASQLMRAGYTSEQFMSTKLKSVAEIEKLLGKKAFEALLAPMVVQGEGKLTLVPEEDKRVEYESADAAFSDMAASNEKEN